MDEAKPKNKGKYSFQIAVIAETYTVIANSLQKKNINFSYRF